MRQRLSSEPDRYRGRRRVPTPPRSRYAAVVTSAFVGAGVVALGAGGMMPDAKAVSPSVLADLENASITADQLADRSADAQRASRDNDRARASDSASSEADVWMLPLQEYSFTAPYGLRWGKLHAGIDLSAPEGTPYRAVHAGVVKSAGWMGGYGYAVVIDHGNGVESIYGHSSRLLVRQGQKVEAGQLIGEVGNTGYSYGAHLHFEVHVHGAPKDPIPLLRDHGVDIKLQVEEIYGDLAAS